MTAIFAYAHNEVAFVAGDTLRVDRNLVRRLVSKVNHWSDTVVLAQAGEADHLTELVANLLPLSGWLKESDEGFFEAFSGAHKRFWQKAVDQYAAKELSPPEGTLLVAASATKSAPARIHKVDFESGRVALCDGPIAADGTDSARFMTDAGRNFQSLQSDPNFAMFPLDFWAGLCVADAGKAFARVVGTSLDALIARPNLTSADRILVHRRFDAIAPSSLDLFKVEKA